MGKAKKAQMKEMALMEQGKALAEAGVTQTNKVVYPPYFAKRKHLLNAGLIKLLQETADREPEVGDVFGEYRVLSSIGTVLLPSPGKTSSGWYISTAVTIRSPYRSSRR